MKWPKWLRKKAAQPEKVITWSIVLLGIDDPVEHALPKNCLPVLRADGLLTFYISGTDTEIAAFRGVACYYPTPAKREEIAHVPLVRKHASLLCSEPAPDEGCRGCYIYNIEGTDVALEWRALPASSTLNKFPEGTNFYIEVGIDRTVEQPTASKPAVRAAIEEWDRP